jgi:uncharacterized protein (TIGR02145 family)
LYEYTTTDPYYISLDSLATACIGKIQPEKHQGICPEGWHIPSNAEWEVLMNYVQTDNDDAGKHLKSMGVWKRNSGSSGEDTYGFAALPGGRHQGNNPTVLSGEQGFWWSSTYKQERWQDPAYYLSLSMRYDNNAASNFASNYSSHSVRCLKN